MRFIEIDLGRINSKKKYFSIMSELFYLPNYFSFTFDSLDECMRDLSWFSDDEIIIKIMNLDRVKNRNIKLYFDINESLDFYQEFWNNCDKKKIIFVWD